MKITKAIRIKESLYIDALKEKVNKYNVFFFLNICRAFSLDTLKKYIMSLLKNNFITFSQTDSFNACDNKTFQSIIKSSELNVSNEIEVFQAVISWVSYDEKNRRSFMCDLLKTVRLPLLPPEVIKRVVGNHPLCKSCQNCSEYIKHVVEKMSDSNKPESTDQQFQNRCSVNKYVPFKFAKNMKDQKAFFETGAGFIVEQLGSKRSSLQVNNFAYRFNERRGLRVISKYDKKWKQILPEDFVEEHAVCYFMKKLYVLGGAEYNDRRGVWDDPLKRCYSYDPKTDRMRRTRSMKEDRMAHSCVVFNGRIVVTGGCTNVKKSVEAYCHFEDRWTYMPAMTRERWGHASVSNGNRMYVIGGNKGMKFRRSCEGFDLVSGRFTYVKPMLRPVSARETFWSNGKIFVWVKREKVYEDFYFFTNRRKDQTEGVFVYDVNADRWTSASVQILASIPPLSVVHRF